GFSIAVRFVRPIFGNVLVKRLCSHSADPSPLTLYLAKFDASDRPTRSPTARDSSATNSNACDRWNVTFSTGSLPGSWNHSGCSSPNPAPHTALCDVRRSWIGVVCSGGGAGSSPLGEVRGKQTE